MEAGSGMSLSGQNRISVALCTYNGERFLPQQLATIASQSRLPDELVVCDDQSTDRTVAIVRDFAATVPYPVRVFEN
jgi:glycosyltransferase involved in cell wall biosynthesis